MSVEAYCQKGRPVAVEGRLEQERWETPAGEKPSRLKVVAQRITFLPGPKYIVTDPSHDEARIAVSGQTLLTRITPRDPIPCMGEVRVEIVVVNPRTSARSEAVVALADTGATLTVIPGKLLEGLGVERLRRVSLVLADGRRAQRDVGDAAVALNGDSVPCRVVFGVSGDAVLLGLTVLEQLGLAVDPVQRRLIPADFLLY